MKHVLTAFSEWIERVSGTVWRTVAHAPSFVWWTLAGIAVLIVVGMLWRRRSRRRRKLLSQMTEKELRSAYQESLNHFQRLRTVIRSLYLPSPLSLTTFIGFGFAALVLNIVPPFNRAISLPFVGPNWEAPLLNVMVGLSTAVFALALFVTESLRGSHGRERGRVLLRESWMFPLTVLVVLIFLVLGFSNGDSWLIGFAVLCLGGLVIRAFFTVIRLLLDAPRLEEARRRLLRDRMKDGARALLRARVMDILFLKAAKEFRYLDYSPSSRWVDFDGEGKLLEIYSDKDGYVKDIDLGKLEYFDNWLSGLPGIDASVDGDDGQIESVERKTKAPGYVFLRPGEEVVRARRQHPRAIGALLDDDSLTNADFKAAERILRSAYKIGPLISESDYLDDLIELQNQAREAIRRHDPLVTRRISDLYIDCVNALLDVFQSHGLSHSASQAKREIHSLEGGWEPIKRLVRNIGHLLNLAAIEGDWEVLKEIAGLPARLVHLSWDYRDQYVFQNFLRFQPQLLRLGLDRFKSSEGQYLVDRSWRFINETVDFFLVPAFEETDVEGWGHAREAIDACLSTYQALLKIAVEAGNEDVVDILATRLQQIRMDRTHDRDWRRASRRDETLNDCDGGERSASETRQRHLEELNQSREEIVIGAAMWALRRWEHRERRPAVDQSMSLAVLKRLMDSLPSSRDDLTRQFLRAATFEKEEAWGWDSWEMEEHADGEVHSIRVQDRIERLFILAMLCRLDSDSIPTDAVLPFTRDFALSLQAKDSSFNRFLNGLAEDHSQWTDLIGEDEVSRIPIFRQLLEQTVSAYRNAEAKEIGARLISESQVNQFIEEVKRERDRIGVIRKLMEALDRIDYQVMAMEENSACLALATVVEKEAFFEDWHVHYVRFGEGFGRSVAQGENRAHYRALADRIGEKQRVRGGTAEILKSLAKWMVEQKKSRGEDWILLASRGFAFDVGLWESKDFVSQWQLPQGGEDAPKAPRLEGILKLEGREIRLYEMSLGGSPSAILLNLETLQPLTVYRLSVGTSFEGAQIVDDMLVRVSDLNVNDQIRDQILKENPKWLAKEEDPENHLRMRALVEIRTKSEFLGTDPVHGLHIEIDSSDTRPNP